MNFLGKPWNTRKTKNRCNFWRRNFNLNRNTRIAVAMSGGVDSSVAAALLKKKGYDVVGIHMQNWDPGQETDDKFCSSKNEYQDACEIGKQLNIPIERVSFEKSYWTEVFSPSIDDYGEGFTPNPDVLCNREIKFKRLLEYVTINMNADMMATGHYCQIKKSENGPQLLCGADKNKDQSYFLCMITSDALKRSIFPIGHLRKSEVRKIAKEMGLITADKQDSYGLCYVGKRKFSDFLPQYINHTPGNFKSIEGMEMGPHSGFELYTNGQKAKIGGLKDKWFVVDKNSTTKEVIIAPGHNHSSLFTDTAILRRNEFSWIAGNPPQIIMNEGSMIAKCMVRYRQTPSPCQVQLKGNGNLVVKFHQPHRAVTVHQVLALYDAHGKICLGGGRITDKGQSYYDKRIPLPANVVL